MAVRAEAGAEELRIVLTGKTGNGKSATGNTILGTKVFESFLSSSSVTAECEKETGEFEGQKLAVIDTPGLFDTKRAAQAVKVEVTRCMSFAAPGPHVFLVVIRLGTFTQEEQDTVKTIQEIFGESAADYTMALFTHGEQLKADGSSILTFINGNLELSKFVSQCRGGFHVLSNMEQDPSQVRGLLVKINALVQRNGGFYTTETLQEAEQAIVEATGRFLTANPRMSPAEARRLAERDNQFIWAVLAAVGVVGVAGAAAFVLSGVEVVAVGVAVGKLGAAAVSVALKKKACAIQ